MMNPNNFEQLYPASVATLLQEERDKTNRLWIVSVIAGVIILLLIIILLSILTRVDEFLIYLIYGLKPCN